MSGKKFRFTLDGLLKLRRYETECTLQELTRTRTSRREQEACIEQAETHLESMNHRSSRLGSIRPQALRRQAAFSREARRSLAEARDELEARRREEAAAQARLMEKRMAEEGLDKLYRREKGAHQQTEAEAEASFLDEQALMRFYRSQQASLL